ncbi:MAG: hypothetical protein ABSE84_11660 [Isosphaeraceae bacterium]
MTSQTQGHHGIDRIPGGSGPAGPDRKHPRTGRLRAKAAAAIPRLQELKESKDPGVKDDATQALAKIKGAR